MQISAPLRNRDFRLLWAGQSVSHIGNGVTHVALAWQALELSRGPGGLSLVLAARSVPLVCLLLVGGAITDRASRRRIMLASDVIRGLTVAAIAVLAATGAIRLWSLVVLAAVFGAADAFFFPASTAIIPELVAGPDLVRANALESFARPLTMQMVGPALGGLLVAVFGTSVAFGLDAATFAVSAACLMAIRARGSPSAQRTGLRREIADGFRYTRRQPWIWATLLMALAAVLCLSGPFQVLGLLVAKDRLGAGAGGYGLIVAAMGAGGIAGALSASRVARGRRITRMYIAWGAA
ncbi:MAG: MFS transporter, partial [Actinomycetota bacterium]